jgi:hypothetical protein
MGLIFFLSAQPDLNSGLGVVDLVGRKLVHMAEFGLLWLLWARALGFRRPRLAAAIAVLYAVSDEFHQGFVSGRNASPLDVAIDSVGVGLAVVLTHAWRERPGGRGGLEPAALGRGQDGLGPVDRPELAVDVVEVGAHGAGRER